MNGNKDSRLHAPGTLVLVFVFFVVFVSLYFANFVLLSRTWPVK